MMSYIPPIWISKKIYSLTLGPAFAAVGRFMLRPPLVGARALYHVATLPVLGDEEAGGGLFSDTAGSYTNCGQPPEDCGRVPSHKLPASATDEDFSTDLWSRTESAIGRRNLRPLSRHTDPRLGE